MNTNLDKILNYILNSEIDDWIESGCPENHVYYLAYVEFYGEKNAKAMLKSELKFRNDLKKGV